MSNCGKYDSNDEGEGILLREPLSAFVITYNEERDISACLDSIGFCDDVLVVDSHSTDRTVEIARGHGARVIEREWPGHKEQKSFALSQTKYEWVLNVDADERVSAELEESILLAMRRERQRRLSRLSGATEPREDVNGYYVHRVVYYLGRWWRRGGWSREYRLRLFRKSKTVWGGVNPHEKATVIGRTERLDGELLHYTYGNMSEHIDALHGYSSIAAKEEFDRGKRAHLWRLLSSPLTRIFKFYLLKRGYREGMAGLIVGVLDGYYAFLKYAKLWELGMTEDGGRRRSEGVARQAAPGSSSSESSTEEESLAIDQTEGPDGSY